MMCVCCPVKLNFIPRMIPLSHAMFSECNATFPGSIPGSFPWQITDEVFGEILLVGRRSRYMKVAPICGGSWGETDYCSGSPILTVARFACTNPVFAGRL